MYSLAKRATASEINGTALLKKKQSYKDVPRSQKAWPMTKTTPSSKREVLQAAEAADVREA